MGRPLLHYLAIFGLSLALMGGVVLCAGTSIWLFLGGLALAGLILPYVVLLEDPVEEQLLLAGCVADGVGLVWLCALLADEYGTFAQWLWLFALLLSAAALQVGLLAALRRVRLPIVVSAGLVVLLWVLWLACPIWLFHHLQTPGLLPWMQRLINVHPIFAVNSVTTSSLWTEAPLAYRVINLNQDVFYSLPKSPLASITLHAVAGVCLILLCRSRRSVTPAGEPQTR
jgi:hypothetical protein